ncbi:MAG TPA: response regulator transcription factor [Terriglobia bacterium]|nr:response regulator transcription factor [Terriglobia bacterium]
MRNKILLVDDEPGLLRVLKDRLESEGYTVETAADGAQGLERASTGLFDLILLDVMLPLKSGIDVCRDLRQHNLTTPILMLTARGKTIDKVLGLKIGADDYLSKPFDMMELLARMEALLRRPPQKDPEEPSAFSFGNVRVDLKGTEVRRAGKAVSLSAREFQLLRYFIEHRGVTLSRQELLREVWGYTATPATRTVDVHVAWLRQKLEPDPSEPKFILTVPGLGYKFGA